MDEPVWPDGPAAYFSTLPVRNMAQAIVDAGLPGQEIRRAAQRGPDGPRGASFGAFPRDAVRPFALFCFFRAAQKLPPMFSSVSITTTQSSRTFCITSFMMFSGIATQPPV